MMLPVPQQVRCKAAATFAPAFDNSLNLLTAFCVSSVSSRMPCSLNSSQASLVTVIIPDAPQPTTKIAGPAAMMGPRSSADKRWPRSLHQLDRTLPPMIRQSLLYVAPSMTIFPNWYESMCIYFRPLLPKPRWKLTQIIPVIL